MEPRDLELRIPVGPREYFGENCVPVGLRISVGVRGFPVRCMRGPGGSCVISVGPRLTSVGTRVPVGPISRETAW